MPRPSLPLLALLSLGCTTQELSESWVIDRLRILAVRPEPAEPRPGETVEFEALVVGPDTNLELLLWFGCLAEEADVMGCAGQATALEDLAEVDPEALSPEEWAALYAQLAEAGLIGAEPWLPPRYEVPADALDDLPEADRAEGLNLFVQVSAFPEGATGDADLELAYKRVPVSEAETPNHNPDVVALHVEGATLGPGVTLEVDAGQSYQLVPVLADDAIETYTYRSRSGAEEERVEEPYFTWFVEEGELSAPWSLHPHGVYWTAPASPVDPDQMLWLVVQDRRGGMGWWAQPVRVR